MRKLVLTGLVGLISSLAMAQTKPLQTVVIKTPTVQCGMCKQAIEKHLNRVDGITFVNVKYKQRETVVKYLTDRTDEEAIKAHIANAGYAANEIDANPEAYKMLPKCCKKPEDPGLKKKQ